MPLGPKETQAISSKTNASLAAANSNGVKLAGFIGFVEGKKIRHAYRRLTLK